MARRLFDPHQQFELWSLSPSYACGGVFVREGRIVGGAPIFKKLEGRPVGSLPSSYRAVLVSGSCRSRGLWDV